MIWLNNTVNPMYMIGNEALTVYHIRLKGVNQLVGSPTDLPGDKVTIHGLTVKPRAGKVRP